MTRGGYMSKPNSGERLPKLPRGPAEGWPRPTPGQDATTEAQTAACNSCGTHFQPSQHQVKSSTWRNCPACRLCLACGEPRGAGPKTYKLRLCTPCRTIAWQSCWRKQAHPENPGEAIVDGGPLYPYHCELCGWWHRTKIPPGADLGSDYNARRLGLSVLIERIGFDIDAFRFRTPTHDPEFVCPPTSEER